MNEPGCPVDCLRCGHEFRQDPVLEVECPTCGALPGHRCRVERPSEYVHSAAFAGLPPWGHDERDLLAASRGHYDHGCSVRVERPTTQAELFV